MCLQGRADVNLPKVGSETPLLMAASRGHTHIVRTLLAAGADSAYTMPNGVTGTPNLDNRLIEWSTLTNCVQFHPCSSAMGNNGGTQ